MIANTMITASELEMFGLSISNPVVELDKDYQNSRR